MKITKATIVALKPGPKVAFIYDDAVAGFGIRLQPTGKASFVFEYRVAGLGRAAVKRRMTLGAIDEVPLEKARRAAGDLLARVRLGADPAGERDARKAEATVAVVVADFIAHAEARLKFRTASEYARILRGNVVPKLGTRPFKSLTGSDVSRVHSAVSKRAPVQANRTIAALSACWNWAARRKIVARHDNPCSGLERNREQAKERFLTDEELSRLGEALRLAETTGLPWPEGDKASSKHMTKAANRFTRVSHYATAAIRLLLLTGARLREVLHLRWEEVDYQRGIAFLSDSKSGRKPLILSAPALQLLQTLTPYEGNPHVIPGEGDKSRADLKRPWEAVTKYAGLDGLRLHDLRHSSASIMAGAGASLQVIGKLLGHTQVSTTLRYSHLSSDPIRQAADQLGMHVLTAMGDKAETADVMSLKRKASA